MIKTRSVFAYPMHNNYKIFFQIVACFEKCMTTPIQPHTFRNTPYTWCCQKRADLDRIFGVFFKNGNLNILVTTDLLARGIDIEFLPCVINYELPRSPKDYVHRIGRTGRAGNPGDAISLVSEEEEHHFKIIQKKMKKWVTILDLDGIDLSA